jgi:raffinose/stachyose/melibiose transport system substrate-binding protein
MVSISSEMRRIRMKAKQLFLVVVLVMAVIGLAFANGTEEEMVELDFMHSKSHLGEQYRGLADEFEKVNPNIKVIDETLGGSADWQTILKGRFAADEGPDVFNIEGPAQYELWSENIADLTGEPFTETAIASALKALNINGRQYGMPVNFEGYGYIYNKDIYADAGITALPTTHSELAAVAQKLEDAGHTAFGTGYATWWVVGLHMLNIAFAQQDDPIEFMDDLTKGTASIAKNKVFQDLKNLVDLTVEYGEDNPLTTDHNRQIQLIANGDVAMIQQGVWKEVPIFKANPDIKIGLVPLLINDDTKMDRVPVGVPWYFVVNAQSTTAEQEAGKKFLDFMANSDVGRRYAVEEFGFIPAFKGVSGEGLGGVGQDILAFAEKDKTIPWVFGMWPDGFAQQDAFNNLQAYVAGKQSWEETLQSLDESWQDRSK